MTPASPSLASTGTDQELATPVAAARPLKGAQSACAFSAITVRWVAAASPAGPPLASIGSLVQRSSSASGSPSDAAHASSPPAARCMHNRSEPSAAPRADKISDRLDDESAATSFPVSPCNLVSWRRADESNSCPDSSALTSSGWTRSEEHTSELQSLAYLV